MPASGIKSVLKVEHFAGDCMKVIGEMAHQLCERDKFQNAEILSLVRANLSQLALPAHQPRLRRPRPTGPFKSNYHSGNELTRSKVRREASARTRLLVIRAMAEQLAIYDGLRAREILSLIETYLSEHIVEVDA